jgi:hypothetical protein
MYQSNQARDYSSNSYSMPIEVVSSLHVYSNSVKTIIGCVMLHSGFRYCKVNKDMFKFLLNFETLRFSFTCHYISIIIFFSFS